MSFWTYMLHCSDGKYYVGHTDNLVARIASHQAGDIPGYAQKRRPVRLVWSETFPTREEAIAAERQVKNWSTDKKRGLISGDWERVAHFALPPARRVPRLAVSTSSTSARDEREEISPVDRTVRVEPASSEAEMRRRDTTPAPSPAIVLVRPQLGENIGKAARAMLNFGLTDLRLVAPRDGWPNPSAGPAASGADIVLERARVFGTVAEAVADCAHVYATTVRKRGLVVPVVTPEEAAREIRTQHEQSAILFGAERSGLETDEVAIAHKILTVPINPEFRSLNLAQAVILVAYEWSKHEALAMPTIGEDAAEPRATQEQLEGLIVQLEGALEAAGYYHPPDRKPTTQNTMRTILTKAGWSNREVQALRGVVRALSEARRRRG
ncbi:MAG TPA: TrmJ/YjtD family RNA methyltransferase [Allosphingosinicella sp.]|nr:TrmJ/YjtD family RNA methyltransferase [Allosphingosinicella sp.]